MGSLLQLLQRPRRQLSRSLLQPSLRCVSPLSSVAAQSSDPSPSELLRATLLGSVTSKTNNKTNDEKSRRVLELLDFQWQRGSPPPSLWYALKGVSPAAYTQGQSRLLSIATLSSLRDVTERLAVNDQGSDLLQANLKTIILRCRTKHPSTEVLSTLGDIVVRLQRLKLLIDPTLYELGMYIAAQNLSSEAFYRFFTGLLELNPGQLHVENGFEIVEALYETVRQELFETPHYDTTHILAEITGEYDAMSESGHVRFHDILRSKLKDDRHLTSWTNYLCLLSRLQSGEPLIKLWNDFLDTFPEESQETLHSMYNVVLDLVRARRSETAAKFLEGISIRNGDNLPHIATFQSLQEILDDSFICETLADIAGDQYDALLEVAFKHVEQRLGIRWEKAQQPENEAHISITADSPWSVFEDHPLLTIDGDCAGYDDPSRLYAELQASGCSRSPNQLGQIVELLHDNDGIGLEVVPDGVSEIDIPELRWCPRHSPVKFSHAELPPMSDRSREWTPASLGLIWVRPLINGVPRPRGKSFHLMQLGSLDMRSGPHEAWQPSGYLVGWDRQSGHMSAVFVGTDREVIDRGPMPSDAPFGTLLRIRPSHMPDSGLWSSVDPFHLDLDPCLDLGFR
ncbi:hypothetical protein N7481_006403 [Penicillium waksmanii]|uniref:uncharacterized protein n=1 Tax=Penicillium waksmanii TaxID=69791 RepID=UPI00254796E0|nr:uncharacterized protein N7481_006403 [Penicillium waksmanii]KAJ5984304.1 hypothetical protein N7481_006403 [Penicillium waksmanii]